LGSYKGCPIFFIETKPYRGQTPNIFVIILAGIPKIKNLIDNMHNNMHNINMKFSWHEQKRKSNLQKHCLDFSQAHKVFKGETFTFEDNRFDYEEQRFVTIGLLDGVVVIVHTETMELIRIISMSLLIKSLFAK